MRREGGGDPKLPDFYTSEKRRVHGAADMKPVYSVLVQTFHVRGKNVVAQCQRSVNSWIVTVAECPVRLSLRTSGDAVPS
jgi:hypothetical protein